MLLDLEHDNDSSVRGRFHRFTEAFCVDCAVLTYVVCDPVVDRMPVSGVLEGAMQFL